MLKYMMTIGFPNFDCVPFHSFWTLSFHVMPTTHLWNLWCAASTLLMAIIPHYTLQHHYINY